MLTWHIAYLQFRDERNMFSGKNTRSPDYHSSPSNLLVGHDVCYSFCYSAPVKDPLGSS